MPEMESKQRERKGLLAVNLGLAANIVLAALKTLVDFMKMAHIHFHPAL
jgi:hypothetical protein